MDIAAAVASAIIAWMAAAGALVGWYLSRRSAQLRKDDVLVWALACIDVLQTIVVICRQSGKALPDESCRSRLAELLVRTSVLVEQGRLYFRNVPSGSFGAEKPPAYRGLRPRVLDCLVIGHEVACHWPNAAERDRLKMGYIIEEATRQFVSTVQKEVGRDRTAFSGAAERGFGIYLPALIETVDENMLKARGWL